MTTWAHLHQCKDSIHNDPFNRVIDLVERIMRHPSCPKGFAQDIGNAFSESHMAYIVVEIELPTVFPAATEEEGEAIARGARDLEVAGFSGTLSHLQKAADDFKQGNWAGSIRESSHAVESVCQQLPGRRTRTVSAALNELQREARIHPALVVMFKKLYGYASNEKGIRHALTAHAEPNVGQEEAVFMLSACAASCSYLVRKTRTVDSEDDHDEEPTAETGTNIETPDQEAWDDVPF